MRRGGELSDDTLPGDILMFRYARRELISSFNRQATCACISAHGRLRNAVTRKRSMREQITTEHVSGLKTFRKFSLGEL